MTARLYKWAAGLDRAGDEHREVGRSEPKIDLASGDARYIQQIIQQPRHVADLPLDDVGGPFALARVGDVLEHITRVADRRERIAQLMREHREKFVLATIAF